MNLPPSTRNKNQLIILKKTLFIKQFIFIIISKYVLQKLQILFSVINMMDN